MAKVIKEKEVRIRVQIAGYELEVTGPQRWADKIIKEFIANIRKKMNETS